MQMPSSPNIQDCVLWQHSMPLAKGRGGGGIRPNEHPSGDKYIYIYINDYPVPMRATSRVSHSGASPLLFGSVSDYQIILSGTDHLVL